MRAQALVLTLILVSISIYELPDLDEVNEAISDIEECRWIHQWWIDYDDELTYEEKRIGGDLEWHQLWVDRYDRVLKILYWVRTLLEALEIPTPPRLLLRTDDRLHSIETLNKIYR